MKGGTEFRFVTEGIEATLAQAEEAAGDKDVRRRNLRLEPTLGSHGSAS
jgi:hypothetical protein